MRRQALFVPISLLTCAASGQTLTLEVDADRSDIVTDVCLHPPTLAEQCADDGAQVSGSIEIELDSYADPALITLHDYRAPQAGDPMEFFFDWGPDYGTLTITLTGVTLRYGGGVPTAPTLIDNNGFFQFPGEVDALISGTGRIQGTGPAFSAFDGEFELADFGEFSTQVFGFVTIVDREVVVDLAAGGTAFMDVAGFGIVVDADADLEATAPAPCRVDVNDDSAVDTRDFIAFLNLWTAADPSADFNADGQVDSQDIILFLTEWARGC